MDFSCKVLFLFYCIFVTYDVLCQSDVSEEECKCVEASRCSLTLYNQFNGGRGLAPTRNSNCPIREICCPRDSLIGSGSPTSVSSAESTNYECQCVLTSKCRSNLEENVDITRNSNCAGTSEICCSPDLIITADGTDDSTTISTFTPTTAYSPSIPDVSRTENTADSCQCVLPQKCRSNPEDSIDVRTNGCSIQEICCTTENIISDFDCGLRNTASNNSKDTSFGEFPWMALLVLTHIDPVHKRSAEYIIGGASLISPKFVLTGQTVLWSVRNVTLLKVRVGEYDTTKGSNKEHKPHQERQVSKIVKHPDSQNFVINLAVLEVAEPFTFDYHIKPICIPSISKTYDYDPSKCVASGWGKMTYVPHPPHFRTPKKVNLTIVPNDQCQKELRKTYLGSNFTLLSSHDICAKSQVGTDACQTDVGGSLVCPIRNDPNRYVQVGIVSWGVSCTAGLPGVYTSLEKNSDWLTQNSNSH